MRTRYRRHSSTTSLGCLALIALPILGVWLLYSVRDPIGAAGLLLAVLVYVGLPALLVWAIARHVFRTDNRPGSTARPVPVPVGPPAYQQTTPQPDTSRTPAEHTAPTGYTHASASQAATQAAKRRSTVVYWGKQRIGWEDEQGVVHLDRNIPV